MLEGWPTWFLAVAFDFVVFVAYLRPAVCLPLTLRLLGPPLFFESDLIQPGLSTVNVFLTELNLTSANFTYLRKNVCCTVEKVLLYQQNHLLK